MESYSFDFWVKKTQKKKPAVLMASILLSVFFIVELVLVYISKKISVGFIHVAMDKR